MAYTSSPQFNTYKTVELPFDGADLYRSGDLNIQRDLNIINFYYERISQEDKKQKAVRLKKRPGLSATTYSMSKSTASAPLRGSFYDVDQNAFYWSVDNKVYSISPDVGISVRTVATLATSSGYVGFCSFLKSDNTRYVIFTDGTDLWVDDYVATTCTEVTDPDLPTPHQPYPVYLDGYLFLIKSDSGDIYNSDNDDPFVWTAGNFITAEISSDYALRLIKAKNYLICLGYNSAEYFWDAGNASGSPLSRNDSPVRSIGYITGLCTIGDTTYFVGQDEKNNIAVYSINSFKIEPVSNAVVNRTLQTLTNNINEKGQVYLNRDGYAVSIDGHTFYLLVTPQTTWAFDVEEKIWYEWKNGDDEGLDIEAVWGMYNGSCYCAIADQEYISVFSPSVYQDFGVDFTCQYTTENTNFETFNWKICHKIVLNCSQEDSSGTSNAQISWSDVDWADGGITDRNINVFSISPYITRCGKFRSRSFRIKYRDNYPFLMMGLSLDLNYMGI